MRAWRGIANRIVFARPTGITKECAGVDRCKSCDERRERAATTFPFGESPMWVPTRSGLFLPLMSRRAVLAGVATLAGAVAFHPWAKFLNEGCAVAAPQPYQGFGATTPGGTGQGIVHVSSNGDSGTGTLRAALQSGASNRNIVFDAPMTITLSNQIVTTGHHITIDGSTAGGSGVTVNQQSGFIFEYAAHDIICTYVRQHQALGGEQDAFQAYGGAFNIVFDHCSGLEANDGCLDVTEGAHDITVQYCILKKQADQFANDSLWTAHGATLTSYGARSVTYHHNLFSSPERNPHIDNRAGSDGAAVGGTPPSVGSALAADIRCNLMWLWGDLNGTSYGTAVSVDGSNGASPTGARANVVKNFMKTTRSGGFRLELEKNHNYPEAVLVYASGNVSQTADSVNVNALGNTGSPIGSPPAITEHDPLTAAAVVLSCAGCRPLDSFDLAIVNAITPNIAGLPTAGCTVSTAPTAPTNVQMN
jgi:hypothetical protein